VTETFEVGQKVRHDAHGDVEVTYGPFHDTFGRTRYVVRLASGTETTLTEGTLDAIPEPPAFAVGDKVTTALYGSGTLVAGPYEGRYCDGRWVVELTNGKHVFPASEALTKVVEQPIKVGDRVRVTDDGGGAHRFTGRVGTVKKLHPESYALRYLVEFGDGQGHHGDLNGRWNCKAVERVEAENTHTYNGVTYDLSAKYKDRDGDVWQFARFGDEVRGTYTNRPVEEHDETLSGVVRSYGPLTRV
jgi:hypothetical protein